MYGIEKALHYKGPPSPNKPITKLKALANQNQIERNQIALSILR